MDVLRSKEQQLLQVRREIDALRIALPLLGEEDELGSPIAAVQKVNQRVVQLP
ncbi:MAG TPA: hypothetical protein VI386_23710 [Candidatus Sulfotelmatobacter sp.]